MKKSLLEVKTGLRLPEILRRHEASTLAAKHLNGPVTSAVACVAPKKHHTRKVCWVIMSSTRFPISLTWYLGFVHHVFVINNLTLSFIPMIFRGLYRMQGPTPSIGQSLQLLSTPEVPVRPLSHDISCSLTCSITNSDMETHRYNLMILDQYIGAEVRESLR